MVAVVRGIGLLDESVSVGTAVQAFMVVASLTAVVVATIVLAQAESVLAEGIAGALGAAAPAE